MVEGQALTFVHCNRPSQSQGILLECAIHFFTYLLRLLINHIFRVFPRQLGNINRLVILLAMHHDQLFVRLIIPSKALHHTYLTIIIFLIGRRVVLDEHHLCAFLHNQPLVRWITALREVLVNLRHKLHLLRGQSRQLLVVIGLCHLVVGGQANPVFILRRFEDGHIPCIQGIHGSCVHLVVANLSQNIDERCILLSIDMFQLYRHILHLLQGLAAKEVWG